MVLGFRVSYHNSQVVSDKESQKPPPICPCAACFNRSGEQEALRAACDAVARGETTHMKMPGGRHASNPFNAGLTSLSKGRTRFGFGLSRSRRRSVDTVASDMRPLRQAGQHAPVDEQSIMDEESLEDRV